LEDILKFDKVQAYVAENNLDQKFEQAEIQVKYSGYIEKKETMRMFTRLEDVKIPRILIMIKLNQCL
jgi:tRNA uridine 5-carboxymethylaminomethyl modification enzyme